MNNLFKYLSCGCSIALLGMGFASCSNDISDTPQLPDGTVTFHATLTPSARSTATEFENGDAIGVFAVLPQGSDLSLKESNFADNVRYVFNGERFQPEGEGIIKEVEEDMAYYAVYPYQAGCAKEFTFSVNSDQTTHELQAASDLCTVTTGLQSGTDVDLKFYHRLTRLVVNVSGFNIAGDVSLELLNAYGDVKADLNAHTYVADASGSKINVKPYQESATSYSVIIPAQSFEAGAEFVKATLNGREFVIKTPTRLEFISGCQYSFNVSLINGQIVLGTGQIMPWDDQTVAEEYADEYFAIENASFVNEEFTPGTDASDPFEISANDRALAGGLNFITIKCDQLYKLFELSVKGVPGFWEFTPENQVTRSGYEYTIPILYGTNFSEDMEMQICGRKPDGTKSVAYDVNVRYVESKSGDLNINLTFSTAKDVDLHLYTPSGQHIYYAERGGIAYIDGEEIEYGLDHDSNPGCVIDNLNNENIFIPAEMIEDGVYTVEVNMWSNCDTSVGCEWSVVARYQGEIIRNENSEYGNPASGYYAPTCGSGDHTKIMTFTLHPGNNRAAVQNLFKSAKPSKKQLRQAEIEKIELDRYFKK